MSSQVSFLTIVSHVVHAPCAPIFTALACFLFSSVPLTSCCIRVSWYFSYNKSSKTWLCFIRQFKKSKNNSNVVNKITEQINYSPQISQNKYVATFIMLFGSWSFWVRPVRACVIYWNTDGNRLTKTCQLYLMAKVVRLHSLHLCVTVTRPFAVDIYST